MREKTSGPREFFPSIYPYPRGKKSLKEVHQRWFISILFFRSAKWLMNRRHISSACLTAFNFTARGGENTGRGKKRMMGTRWDTCLIPHPSNKGFSLSPPSWNLLRICTANLWVISRDEIKGKVFRLINNISHLSMQYMREIHTHVS